MPLIFRLFVSLSFIILLRTELLAQKFIPHTLTAGLDLPTLVRSIANSNRGAVEAQVGVNLASHMLLLEYGFENIDRSGTDFSFNTRGPYFRTGIDFTLNPKNPDGHQIFVGFRYARSNFRNSIQLQDSSANFNDPVISENNDNLRGSWLEATFGMKLMLKSYLGMGYTMRFKFSPDVTGADVLSPFDLPGFGRARKSTNFGVSYYVFYRFRFRKDQRPAPIND